MRLLTRTLSDGVTELLLRDEEQNLDLRAQHFVYAVAQEMLYAKALNQGVDQDTAHDAIFGSV